MDGNSATAYRGLVFLTCHLGLAMATPAVLAGQEGPAVAEGATSSRELSDLYPDVPLPGAGTTDANTPAGRSDTAGSPDAGLPPANPRDDGQDPFADLYPDQPLPDPEGGAADADAAPSDAKEPVEPPMPGEGPAAEPQETPAPGGDDSALIEELLSDSHRPPWEGIDPQDIAQRSPRELLALFDPPIDESQLRSLEDGQPLVSAEEETLTRVLYRLPRFGLDQIDRWAKEEVQWDDLVKEPGFFRMEFFSMLGRAREITRIKVIPEIARRLGFDHYYRVAVDLDDVPFSAVVCTQNIPNAWIRGQNEGQSLDERAGCSGLFVKVGGQREGATELVFAARRVAWYPDHLDPELGVTESKVMLGDLGMDVGLLEFVKDASPIVQADREPFYQMLAAVGRAEQDELTRRAATTHDIGEMLLDPKSQRATLMSLRGNARRVTKIAVDDPDIRQRFGIDHYYEIAVFVPVDRRIEIPVADDEPPRRFDNDYPMIFCVRELPEGMPRGPDIREAVPVQIPAFYFKLYAYKSQYMSSVDRSRRQLSPLLIGLAPFWIDDQRQSNPWFSVALGGLFIVAMAGIWFGLWRYSRADRQFERSTLAKQFELSEGKSLNDMGIEASSGPDFSGLEAADKSAARAPESKPDDV